MKKAICVVLCFLMLLSGISAFAAPEVIQGVNNNAVLQKVNVSGTMGAEYSGKYVTFFAVTKGVTPATAVKDDFIYIKQLTLGEGGSYEFGFQVNKATEFDVYVNEAGSGLVKCQPEKTNVLLEATVEKRAVSEGVYNIKASLENTFGYSGLNVAMIIGYYADGRMVDVTCKSFNLDGGSVDEAFENITASGNVTQIKFFIFMEESLKPVTEAVTVYDKAMGYGDSYITATANQVISTYGDENDKYLSYGGRWQSGEFLKNYNDESQGTVLGRMGTWANAYVSFRVMPTSSNSGQVKLNVAQPRANGVSRAVHIFVNGEMVNPTYKEQDAKWVNLSGRDISKYLSPNEINEVMIMSAAETTALVVTDITLGEGVRLYEMPDKLKILTTGASQVSATGGFSKLLPMQLGADFSVISRSGSALQKDYGRNNANDVGAGGYLNSGMIEQYLKLGTYNTDEGEVDFDFSTDMDYDVIIINHGTNDNLDNSLDTGNTSIEDRRTAFVKTYVDFIELLHEKHPNAKIIAMRSFNGNPINENVAFEAECRDAAFKALAENAEFKSLLETGYVYYFDTSDLELAYYDAYHPEEYWIMSGEQKDAFNPLGVNGHTKLANELVKFMKENGIIE